MDAGFLASTVFGQSDGVRICRSAVSMKHCWIFAKGRMVILVDDEDRENEGDLCMAAEKVTPQAINFMAKHGRGLICLSLHGRKSR